VKLQCSRFSSRPILPYIGSNKRGGSSRRGNYLPSSFYHVSAIPKTGITCRIETAAASRADKLFLDGEAISK
jgi:hypothetical protein